MDTYYEILDVAVDADQSSIKNAYRKAAAAVHPDKGGNSALFRTVQKAYEVLGDPLARREYDKSLHYDRAEQQTMTSNTKTQQKQEHEKTNYTKNEQYHDDTDYNFDVPQPTHKLIYRLLARKPWIFSFILTVVLIKFNIYSLAVVMLGLSITSALGASRSRVATNAYHISKLKNSNIDSMPGTEFELFLVALLKSQGYKVVHTGKPGDFGADIIFKTRNVKYVVQARPSSASVGAAAVSEVVGAKARYGATEAVVITNSHFTQAAKKAAKSSKVLLWERDKIESLLETADPETTFSAALDSYIRSIGYGALRAIKIAITVIVTTSLFRKAKKIK